MFQIKSLLTGGKNSVIHSKKSLNNFIRNRSNSLHSSLVYNKVVADRHKYSSPSLKTFEAYDRPLILDRGEMQYMWDSDGNKYIDLLGQNLCISVGHCHPKVVDAATQQMKKLSHCTTMYYHEEPTKLCQELTELLPPHPSGEDWVVHLVNTGSEAVDLAVQMARVYTGRPEMIALQKAYHGLHGYAAGLTAIGKATQASYSSMFSSITHLESNNLNQLENHLTYNTGGKVAGMIMEPLQGYGGIYPLDKDYMKNAFELIHQRGGVTIADEVQTGFNRCGESFWGFQMKHNDVIPDMITIAKGMGNGVGIIAAVVCKKSIAEAFSDKMFFNTYGSNPTAAAASRAVIKVMKDENILDNCKERGEQFTERVSKLCNDYPQVFKEIRGSGLFQGLEIAGKDVEDSGKNAYELHSRLLPHGVVVGRGSAAGNVFRLQPPMCIESHDVDHVVDSIEEVGKKWVEENNL
jgi:alanine-glyoxylate transaminase / (R)-3-amino-2-methylpropionate-pyruvate transaminase